MAGKNDRLDLEDLEFHRRVYSGFKEVSKWFERCVNIEAQGSEKEVFEKVLLEIEKLLVNGK